MYKCSCVQLNAASHAVYEKCEVARPERHQLTFKTERLIQNVEFLAGHGFLCIYLLKSEVKLCA